jgi:hypothetical protein
VPAPVGVGRDRRHRLEAGTRVAFDLYRRARVCRAPIDVDALADLDQTRWQGGEDHAADVHFTDHAGM